MSLGQGHVRAIFDQPCNAAEPKVMKSIYRYVVPDSATFIAGLNPFCKLHETSQHGLTRPVQLTPEGRRRTKRQRAAAADEPCPRAGVVH